MGKYKLVIVEDEPPILRNIKQKIEASNTNFIVSGLAYDGIEALSVIEETKPAVVLTDINLPLMNGLSLILNIKEKFPDTIFVIISGYKDFEYARQAMKLGVEDYLSKPVDDSNLKDVLTNIEKKLDKKKTEWEWETLNSALKNENYCISKNKNSHISRPEPFDDEKNYYVMSLCFGPYSTCPVNLIFSDSVQISNQGIEQIILSNLKENEKCWVFNGHNINEKAAIIMVCNSSREDIIQISRQLILQNEGFRAALTISISDHTKFSTIGVSNSMTKILLQNSLVIGKSQVLTQNQTKNAPSNDFVISSNFEKKLSTLLLQCNTSLLKAELIKLFQTWEKQDCPQVTMDKLLKHLFTLLQRQTLNRSTFNSFNTDIQINELLSTSFSFTDVFQGYWFMIENLYQDQQQKQKGEDGSKNLINDSESYIRQNITEPLNLEFLAAMVNLSPPYYCMLFKQYKGASPIEYLINLRIEKAKELMRNKPQISIKDVAETVGYMDQHYFSRVFKSITRLSPTEFREHIQLS